ncbi:DsbA family protein [Sphingomicrobium flavum]|uniref:DsbA family protein n=1 Tax=Sphingomicrobium flavum TaxID=1229164 RepID=UPI0021AD6A79|nr:DsbA family protein [Sphingomicrobium flavum]
MANNMWVPAIVGGVVGALGMAAIGAFAMPSLIGPDMVREALLNEPEMLVEASDVLRDRQFAPTIDANRALFETPFASSFKGAEDAEVVMVEFFDYACGYCRQTKPDVERLVAEMPDLKVVYRELPVLGPDSVLAAKASLAASEAGKFSQFHDRLFALGGLNEANLTTALAEVGLDMSAIDKPEYDAEIQKNYELANLINSVGTPTFVVGDRVIPAAEGYRSYKDAIEAARRGKKDS